MASTAVRLNSVLYFFRHISGNDRRQILEPRGVEGSRHGRLVPRKPGRLFSRQTARSRRFFRRLIAEPNVSDLLQGVAEARGQRDADRSAPKPEDHCKLVIMLSIDFAREKVPEIVRSLSN